MNSTRLLGAKAFWLPFSPHLFLKEPSDQKGKEIFKLFVFLNDRFQALWNLTEENYRILKQKCSTSEAFCVQDFYIVWKGDLFLSLYIQ